MGHLLSMEDNGDVVVFTGADVVGAAGGVGYAVTVHDRDRTEINARGIGSFLVLFVRAVTRETGTRLFGFQEADDRRAFDAIVAVDGCGPALAMRLLSTMSASRLKEAIAGADTAALRVPGCGVRTAQKLVAEVRW